MESLTPSPYIEGRALPVMRWPGCFFDDLILLKFFVRRADESRFGGRYIVDVCFPLSFSDCVATLFTGHPGHFSF